MRWEFGLEKIECIECDHVLKIVAFSSQVFDNLKKLMSMMADSGHQSRCFQQTRDCCLSSVSDLICFLSIRCDHIQLSRSRRVFKRYSYLSPSSQCASAVSTVSLAHLQIVWRFSKMHLLWTSPTTGEVEFLYFEDISLRYHSESPCRGLILI